MENRTRFRRMYYLGAGVALVILVFLLSQSSLSFNSIPRADNTEPRSDSKSMSHFHQHPQSEEEPKPQSKEEPKRQSEEEPKPQSKEEPKPQSEEEPRPQFEEEPKPQSKEEPKPQSEEEPKPQSEGEPKPQSEERKPQSGEEHTDTHTAAAEPAHSDTHTLELDHSDSTSATDQVSLQPSCHFLPSDSNAPLCPLCSTPTESITEVSVYLHDFDAVNRFWAGNEQFSKYEAQSSSCELNSGVKCVINHDNPQSDGVVYFTRSQLPPNGPRRYCYPQVIILFNTEVEHAGYDHGYKPYTEVMYDYHLKSDIRYIYPCSAFHVMAHGEPPKPEERSGFAMFISNCGAAERLNYLKKLQSLITIDSYGGCLHNTDRTSDRYVGDWPKMVRDVLSKYRLAIAYENTISPEYITEKAFLALSAGAIPVYKGPPEIYHHIPDRHNIINIDDYASPEELAKYLRRVLDDNELYLHHATLNMTKVEEYKRTVCSDGPVACQMCEKVYQLKVASLAGGSRPCSCTTERTNQ